MKTFALFAHTPGDDLFPPTKTIITTSTDPAALKAVLDGRTAAREQWMKSFGDQIPGYAMAGLIDKRNDRGTADTVKVYGPK